MLASGAAVRWFMSMATVRLASLVAAVRREPALEMSSNVIPMLIVKGLRPPASPGRANHGMLMPVLPSRR